MQRWIRRRADSGSGTKKEPRESGSVVGSKRKLAVDVAVDHIVGDGFVRVDINLDVG